MLQGALLPQSSVHGKVCWRRGWHIKLKEDAAYSLSSILNTESGELDWSGRLAFLRREHGSFCGSNSLLSGEGSDSRAELWCLDILGERLAFVDDVFVTLSF